MKDLKRIFLVFVSCALFAANTPVCAFAQETNEPLTATDIDESFNYIHVSQDEMGAWIRNNHDHTESITNILEYLSCHMENQSDMQTDNLNEMITSASDYVFDRDYMNVDGLSRYLLVDSLFDPFDLEDLLYAQNPDGGFGLAEGYTSDIIDIYACGNENGQHHIVALAGLGDGEMFLGWRQMTAEIEQDNYLIFLDRAGYGLSDDTKQEMTPEIVVEEYRTALQNAGIKAPYLLMGHSLGGMYATYWECNYPDEIEGVIFVDGSICFEIPEEEQLDGGMAAVLMPVIEKLGLAPFVIRSDYERFLDTLPKEQKEQSIYLMSKTLGSFAVKDEMNKVDWYFDLVWKEMSPTDIPKIFISSSTAYHTKEDFINDGIPAESLLNVWVLPTKEKMSDDEIYEEALRMMEQRRTEWAEPYYEKLGNCEVIELPGDHVIFLDKPDKCSRIIKEFIDGSEPV